ncbi:MAG TPA: hypothetical protein DDZ80_17220 [Cyanobacteria bacterium UBA8803]|nr:hypothetical protein [Cyanobacteria bacterium UBA9273]HBL60138.1 hypothetical protein [Cyanobacteria bacterium UBA8803]
MLNKQPKNRIHKQQLNTHNLALNSDKFKKNTDAESSYGIGGIPLEYQQSGFMYLPGIYEIESII